MIKFGKAIVKHRVLILVLAILLLVPSLLGMINTRINYDMLTYLPSDMETVQGQNILKDQFGKGAFAFVIVEGMDTKQTAELEESVKAVAHVDSVIWYDDVLSSTVPAELLPEKYYDAFNSGDATMMAVFFDTSTSDDDTLQAIKDVRAVAGEQCFVTGLSAVVSDLKDLCEQEEPIYVGLAVLFACIAMMIFMDCWIVPVIFLISIGMAIVYNLGSNYFLGEISYLTKALSAVLQLAVTMDYSIFLWHSYSEQKERYAGDKPRAMAHAIKATITSVLGSSLTTIAGFIALCFMSYTLGADLGIVMAKGVLFGVIGCVTTLPALILILDKPIEKTKHKPIIPRRMDKVAGFITKRSWVFLIIFAILIVPAYLGYSKTNDSVYYDMSTALPRDMDSVISNTKLGDYFDVGSTHMVLVDADTPEKDVRSMISEMENVDGVKYVLGMESVVGPLVPEDMIPDSIKSILESDQWELLLINSQYHVASNDVNEQINSLNGILKEYDEGGMLIGEAPCTKDLIEITNHDFQVVTAISIVAIFLIIAIVEKSISLPVILVAVIEFAIFINLGIPYYTGTSLSFVAPICISTIQLGATVDYAILMTTRYKRERSLGQDKRGAVTTALSVSMPSIIVSALGFFAATFGVAMYSDIDIISSMCELMARGAMVSMVCVIFVLPSLFMVLDKVICKSSMGFKSISKKETEVVVK